MRGVPPVYYQSQNGMLGVIYLTPHVCHRQHGLSLTYVEPGEYGGGLALGRGKLNLTGPAPALQGFEVLWKQLPKGMGGQPGAQIAFAPDGNSLFLTVGDRQRIVPAQDPSQAGWQDFPHDARWPARAPEQSEFRQETGAATVNLIDPLADTEAAKNRQGGERLYLHHPQPDPCLLPGPWCPIAPYGLAFAPNGELWEMEHGPKGGDSLNLIKKGGSANGWPNSLRCPTMTMCRWATPGHLARSRSSR